MEHAELHPPLGTDWAPPEEFAEYRIVRSLGRGQMGRVFLAWDQVLRRHVAVKFVAQVSPSQLSRDRFLVEARAAARLQHPNVVTVHRVGELAGRPYLVSEYVRGESLERIEKPLKWARVLDIGLDLARGLAAAHREGILHRDIKPANAVLAEDQSAKLLDFGLAKFLEEAVGVPGEDASATAVTLPPEGADLAELAAAAPRPSEVGTLPVPGPPSRAKREGSPEGIGGQSLQPGRRLTAAGFAIGTPDYMAPEAWRGVASPRSDVYSLGAVLYELCTGRPPHGNVSLAELYTAAQDRDVTSLALAAPGVHPRLGWVIDRCLKRDPAARFASGEELRAALEEVSRTGRFTPIPEGNPYRGLRPFEAEHRNQFFGRGTEVGALLDRLRSEPFILVTGDSGAGKSSLCRAGVAPLVDDGALGDGRAWQHAQLVPGRRPLISLARALAGHLDVAEDALAAELRADPPALVRRLVARTGATSGLLVFVDQLEELLTIADRDEAGAVVDLLARVASGWPGVRLLATVRTDFLARLAGLPHLGEAVPGALYILRPLSPEGAREVVVGPVRRTGVRFESDALVDQLVATVYADGGLPLLSFALAALWDVRDRERSLITAGSLERIGGVAGALARHADAVVEGLLPAQRRAARRLLVRLVTVAGTRARRDEAELFGGDPASRAALDALVRGRILVAHEAEEGTAYELAHEVLIEGWSTLRRWLHEDEEARALRERLEVAAAEWQRLGRAREALWRARQLAELDALPEGDLPPRERAFIAASRRAQHRRRRLRWALLAGIPLLFCATWAGIELRARHLLDKRVAALTGEALPALGRARARVAESDRLRSESFARFDAQKRDDGERLWSRALALADEAELDYAGASRALEAAVALAPGRADVRGLFADVLFERALLAEQARRATQRDELANRLALYDQTGDRVRRFHAPAALTIATTPPGATVFVARYQDDGHRNLHLSAPRLLGAAPLADVALDQGSYALTFTAPGRAPVTLPVLAGRAERLAVAVELPAAGAVPPGFLYVPAGRFLYGSTGDEEARRGFFDTVPAHTVTTAAYLIARHEVTYADWIAYLRALPPDERARRTPSVPSRVGHAGSVSLAELPDGSWQFQFQLADETRRARDGEPVRYTARDRRAAGDWLRFPVAGISFDDARAYVAWLGASGRVRGARLCTEHEWERAARGADGRLFPHGDRLAPDDANYDATYGRATGGMGPDEIGSHPASRSPFGADDMVGNIYEWTTSPDGAVARGGAWFYDPKTNQVINRQVVVHNMRDSTVGLRVCATP